jgi:hypothetical protein
MSLPDFGKGSPAARRSRRMALAVGGFLLALIVGLLIYAIVA